MSLQFTWADLWAYCEAIVDPIIKEHLFAEVVGDGWLFRQSAKEQTRILKGAPDEFIKTVAPKLRPEVQIELGYNPYL